MSGQNDGGPAFPVREAERFNPENNETHAIEQHWGMSLRDWFAGQALMGSLATGEINSHNTIADECYEYADAMLRARNTPPLVISKNEQWAKDNHVVVELARAWIHGNRKGTLTSGTSVDAAIGKLRAIIGASGGSGGAGNPYDTPSSYAGPVVFDGKAKGPQ